jgi:hypothetical protein
MLKSVFAGLAALTIVGASLVAAQPAPPQPSGFRLTPEDTAALTDARIAGLRAGLKLTPEQEKSWPAVETALRDLAKQRVERFRERAERFAQRQERRRDVQEHRRDNQARPRDGMPPQVNAMERLRSRATALTNRGAAMTKLADAVEPLFKTLDDGQKRRLALLMRMGRGPGPDGMNGPRGPRGPGMRWQRRTELDQR